MQVRDLQISPNITAMDYIVHKTISQMNIWNKYIIWDGWTMIKDWRKISGIIFSRNFMFVYEC